MKEAVYKILPRKNKAILEQSVNGVINGMEDAANEECFRIDFL